MLLHRPALQDILNSGGRRFFNGHILRRFVDGLGLYVPLDQPNRADLAMKRLSEHPIFAGKKQRSLEENKGVAGFYGRGHNPLPENALAINGIGPQLLPINWDWALPGGGRMFSRAGNDLGGMGGESGDGALLTQRIIAWCAGDLP